MSSRRAAATLWKRSAAGGADSEAPAAAAAGCSDASGSGEVGLGVRSFIAAPLDIRSADSEAQTDTDTEAHEAALLCDGRPGVALVEVAANAPWAPPTADDEAHAAPAAGEVALAAVITRAPLHAAAILRAGGAVRVAAAPPLRGLPCGGTCPRAATMAANAATELATSLAMLTCAGGQAPPLATLAVLTCATGSAVLSL
jgi:hypothetical protein